jgi:acylphosphatase
MLIAKKYWISGRVQGVGFRFFAEREAKRLSLLGYVRNLADGRVEVYAIGEARPLSQFRQRLAGGPAGAHVKSVEDLDEPVDHRYHSFEIEG